MDVGWIRDKCGMKLGWTDVGWIWDECGIDVGDECKMNVG